MYLYVLPKDIVEGSTYKELEEIIVLAQKKIDEIKLEYEDIKLLESGNTTRYSVIYSIQIRYGISFNLAMQIVDKQYPLQSPTSD